MQAGEASRGSKQAGRHHPRVPACMEEWEQRVAGRQAGRRLAAAKAAGSTARFTCITQPVLWHHLKVSAAIYNTLSIYLSTNPTRWVAGMAALSWFGILHAQREAGKPPEAALAKARPWPRCRCSELRRPLRLRGSMSQSVRPACQRLQQGSGALPGSIATTTQPAPLPRHSRLMS